MATYTSHLNLKLPDYSDTADINDLNDNFKKIDDAIASGGTETDPTVPAWAKQPSKPTYTAGEVGARPDTWMPSASEVGADASGTASGAVAAHNVSGAAHADLRALIEGLNSRLNALADSDDTTLDQLSEIVAYIKSNRTLIDAVTTGKVSTSDIVDNLTTNASGKVLSAAQGVALKAMIDGIVIPTALPNPQPITINGQRYDGSEAVTVTTVEIDDTLTQSGKASDAKAVGDRLNELNGAKVSKPSVADDGKIPRAKEGEVEWVEIGQPTDEQTNSAVTNWLNDHPEATTTVQDKSITEQKISDLFLPYIKKDFVTPQMYGAKGDGVTDDSISFQNMLDATEWNKLIFIPNGTYIVKNLELKNECRIFGTGIRTILKLPDNAINGDYIMHESEGSYGYTLLRDLVLDGNKTNLPSDVICNGLTNGNGYNKCNSLFYNVIFRNFTGSGIKFDNHTMEYTIDSCKFSNNDEYGAYLPDFMDSRISNSVFNKCLKGGIFISGSTVKMTNSKCFMNGTKDSGYGMCLKGIHHSVSNVEIQENYFDGVVFDTVNAGHIEVLTNCNNEETSVGSCQVRIIDSSSNYFNIMLSGGYMNKDEGGRTVFIEEKNGIIEKGNCRNNQYNVQMAISRYLSDNQPISMNPFVPEYEGIPSNKYVINGDEWFTDGIYKMNFEGQRPPSYCDNASVEISNDFALAKFSGTISKSGKYTTIMSANLSAIYPIDEVNKCKKGDVVIVTAIVKNTIHGKTNVILQNVTNGSYKNATKLFSEQPIADNWAKITSIFELDYGVEDGTFSLALHFALTSNDISHEIGEPIEMYIKNVKSRIVHLNEQTT